MRRTVGCLAVIVLSLGLAGCGGDEEPPEASPSTSESPSEPASDEPTEEPSPTVEPIEGVTRTTDAVSVTVPKGWRKVQYISAFVAYLGVRDGAVQQISFGGLPILGVNSLDKIMKSVARDADFLGKYEVLDELTGPLDVPMFHIRGETHRGTKDVIGGRSLTHEFRVEVISRLPIDEHEALVESVIPTIDFP